MKNVSQIHFALAQNLSKELREKSPVKEGLVAVFVSFNSPPEFEVKEVKGSPMDFIKKLAEEEGVTQKELNRIFKREKED
jgi:hypothetical protein